MKAGIFVAAALARLACAQDFDFAAVLDAPAPSETSPPLAASNATTSSVNSAVVSASISREVAPTTASVTGAAASAASTQDPDAADLEKRWGWNWGWNGGWGQTTTKTTMQTMPSPTSTPNPPPPPPPKGDNPPPPPPKGDNPPPPPPTGPNPPPPPPGTTNTPKPTTTSTSTTSQQQSSTTTTSSESACPTTPEEGTYCGFINPEDPCAPQPDGYGPKVQPDTVEAFEAYPEFHREAQNAPTPSGYERTFVDLNASVSANSYITFYTLESYDTAGCAQHCDDTDLCTAFNIYIERDPSLNPTTNATDSKFNCPNPSSITNYKCSLWGSSIDASSATNEGGYRDEFQVVVVGSNGYDKTNNTTPATPPNWEPPHKCPGGAISAGGQYHLGSKFFPGPFNPALCGTYAETQTSSNRDAAKAAGKHDYTPCNMFNAYMVQVNGVAKGTYCSLFDTVLSDKWAAFQGSWSGNNWFGVESSWTYSLKNLDSGKW